MHTDWERGIFQIKFGGWGGIRVRLRLGCSIRKRLPIHSKPTVVRLRSNAASIALRPLLMRFEAKWTRSHIFHQTDAVKAVGVLAFGFLWSHPPSHRQSHAVEAEREIEKLVVSSRF